MQSADAGMGTSGNGIEWTGALIGRGLRSALSTIAIAALCLASGCSGFFVYPGSTGGGSTGTGDYVYVANAATANIAGFAVGTGTLTAVANSPYALSVAPQAMAINPANTILYVAAGSSIYAYGIQSTGALSLLNGGTPVATATAVSMDISPDGVWLLALEQTPGAIDEYQINASTGALSGKTLTYSASTASGAVAPAAIKFAPNGLYLFAALGTAGDLSFQFSTGSGALTSPQQLLEPTSQNSDSALAVDPNSTYLYIARSGLNGGLAVYAINGGALSPVSGSPFAASNSPASEKAVLLNKAGTDVYVANYKDGTISGFSIGSGGALTALGNSPYSSGSLVTGLAADNSGNYLLAVSNGGLPDLAVYGFDATTAGKLDLAASSATGIDPTGAVAIAATH